MYVGMIENISLKNWVDLLLNSRVSAALHIVRSRYRGILGEGERDRLETTAWALSSQNRLVCYKYSRTCWKATSTYITLPKYLTKQKEKPPDLKIILGYLRIHLKIPSPFLTRFAQTQNELSENNFRVTLQYLDFTRIYFIRHFNPIHLTRSVIPKFIKK